MKHHALRQRMRATRDAAPSTVPTTVVSRLDIPQPGSLNFDDRVRETLMVYLGKQGDFLDRGVTVRDMLSSGVVTLPDGWKPGASGGGGIPPFTPVDPSEPDLSPPPDVSGFVVTPGISVVFYETDPPAFTQGGGYLRTHVYGKAYDPATDPLPTFADAQEIYSFTGEIGSMATEPLQTLRVWAKWESRDGVLSVHPVGGTNGIEVTTGQDVDALVKAMTGPGNPFKIVDSPILLPDGTTVPEGVYISDAYIHSMQVVTAMIHDLAVTNAKVQSLSASKLTAGKISVGEYISSSSYVPGGNVGWIINGADDAIFNNVTARGNIFASGGAIGGAIIAPDYVQSTNYSTVDKTGWRFENSTGDFFINELTARGDIKGGAFTSSAWPAAGQTGYFLGAEGLRIGNLADGKYFTVSVNGDVSAPGFSITGGNATFSGLVTASAIKATKISVGEAGNPVGFYDETFPDIPLRSVGHGSLNFHGATAAAVVTGTEVKFTVGDGATQINRRIRTGTVRFLLTATATADHYFSLWWRKNGGAWTFLYTAVEPAPNAGAVSAGTTMDTSAAPLVAGDILEFGMSATNSAHAAFGTNTDLLYAALNVLAFNF